MTAAGLDDPRAPAFLTAEHASLTAARSQGQSEMMARAAMFVAALSGALVAIAFVAQATRFPRESIVFTLMLLSVVLFLGLTTVVRTLDLITEDLRWAAALNRIRHAYLELVPGLEPYFATGRYDDLADVLITINPSGHSTGRLYGLVTTPGVIAVVNAVVAAAIGGVAASLFAADAGQVLAVGAAAFALVLLLQAAYGARVFGRVIRTEPAFGRPDAGPSPDQEDLADPT